VKCARCGRKQRAYNGEAWCWDCILDHHCAKQTRAKCEKHGVEVKWLYPERMRK